MQSNKRFLLTDIEGNNIAVISKKGKASPSEFNSAIELAVKEHFNADKVSVFRADDELELTAESDEDGDVNIRDFTLKEIVVY